MQQQNPKVRALVVADGPAKEEAQIQLPNGVFTGFCSGENLARAYASSDLFLFPSYTETFGNVIRSNGERSSLSGRKCYRLSSLVVDGQNGRLARSRDIDDFSKKLEQ